ncbi:hypothetical protein [Nocardioides euryhalodurans]|uniref:Uncharacterized protein n=1 Tax=Nocardioides euryhalodurans TaxID=2518370 RepID=A0A4P7GHA1_9ACTN|nr:hypothetical protein [Nocardioides euryhalodurans]QBR91111.1 hypothetical protein EXE57_01625 [Nocardioides euryhalodurans]
MCAVLLLVTVGLSLVTTSPSAATQATCNSLGYTKGAAEDKPSGNQTYPFGTLSWSNRSVDYSIKAGYTVELCVKASTIIDESGPIAGPKTGTFSIDHHSISHIGYKVTQSSKPVDPEVVFTDSSCVADEYVAPSYSAPSYEGLTKTVTGNAVPGGTVTVTYVAKPGWTIVGPASFSHTFPSEPSSHKDCKRPDALVEREPGSSSSCDPAGVTSWVDVYTTPYVWDAASSKWVLGERTGPVRADETFTPYTDAEYAKECAPDQPEPKERQVPGSSSDCEPAGVTSWVDVYTTPYVWDAAAREWVLGDETGPVRTGEAFTPYTDAEYFEECATDQPDPKQVEQERKGCDLSHLGDGFGAGSATRTGEREYVWDTAAREWVLERNADVEWGAWSFTPYTDAEYFKKCAPEQPEPKSVSQTDEGCELSQYGEGFGAGTVARDGVQEYVWDAATRTWVLEPESEVSWGAWAFTPYTDAEYFKKCAPDEPQPEPVMEMKEGCDLSQYGDGFGAGTINRLGSQEYVWDAATRTWVLEPESEISWAAWDFTPYTDAEYLEKCAPEQPEPKSVSQTDEGCDLSQYGEGFGAGTVARDGVQEYVWDAATRTWVLEPESEIAWGAWAFTAYTDAEYFKACAPEQPPVEPVSQTDEGCDLSQYGEDFGAGTVSRDGEQEYVWDAATRTWVLEPEWEIAWGAWAFTPYTDDEYLDLCAPAQPEPIVREVAGAQASCKLRGQTTWVDSYRTEYVWDAALREWVLGEETGPVRTNETFTAWSTGQFADECAEPAGDQETDEDDKTPPVAAGAQASGAVPTVVDAGATVWQQVEAVRRAWWLLLVGGGLGLIGFAGTRRRTSARR